MNPVVKAKKVKNIQKGDVIVQWWRREFITVYKVVKMQNVWHIMCKGPTGLKVTLNRISPNGTEDVVTCE
jgi:hypothetical protein